MPHLLLIGLTLTLLAVASGFDLYKREIPDAIPALLLLLAIIALALRYTRPGLVLLAFGLVIGLALGFLAFRFGLMGGGDAKLLAALGAVVGGAALPFLMMYVAIAGGVMAIVSKIRKQKEVPFAPAFAVGYAVLVWLTWR